LKGDSPAATSREQLNKRSIYDPGLKEETKINAHNCVKHFWKKYKKKMKRLLLQAQVPASFLSYGTSASNIATFRKFVCF
jgi:hypothetical protein